MTAEMTQPESVSGVDLLDEVTSELVPEAMEANEKSSGEEIAQTTELAETEVKTEPEPTKKLDPVVQQSIDKRIAKEVRKRKDLEAELESERARVTALESQVTQTGEAKKSVELADMTPAQLVQADKEAREYMVWAMDGPMENGHEGTDADGESKFYEPEEIKEIYQHYHRKALLDIPEAQNQKQTIARKLNQIAEEHPELQDEGSIEYKTFKEVWLSPDFAQMRGSSKGVDYAYAIARGRVSEKLKAPEFTPQLAPLRAQRVPMTSAPSRPRVHGKQETTSLSDDDFNRAGAGQIDDIVAKLLQ
tara:strand:- start:13689 stop:14603 length:915 start_codon:yes stop_codon:yes gene_type:complete